MPLMNLIRIGGGVGLIFNERVRSYRNFNPSYGLDLQLVATKSLAKIDPIFSDEGLLFHFYGRMRIKL